MARRDENRHDYTELNYSNTLSKDTKKSESIWIAVLGEVTSTLLPMGIGLILFSYLNEIFGNIKNTIEFVIIICGMSGFIILIMSILATKKQLETNFKQDLNYRKVEKSIKYISEWNNQQFSFLMEKIILNQENSEYYRIEYFIKEDPSFEKDIITVINFLEQMAISIEYELVDEELLYRYFKAIVLKIFSTLEVWINERRRTKQERLYESLERLYDKWR